MIDMGYLSRVSGELIFSPAAVGVEARRLADAIKDNQADIFSVPIHEDLEETVDGILTRQSSDSIIVNYDGAVRAYYVKSELQMIVDALPKDTEFEGEFRVEGERVGDIRRFVVVDGEVREWKATITWPDGQVENFA
jgi:hypothetical protein